jgi:hypothetical protein
LTVADQLEVLLEFAEAADRKDPAQKGQVVGLLAFLGDAWTVRATFVDARELLLVERLVELALECAPPDIQPSFLHTRVRIMNPADSRFTAACVALARAWSEGNWVYEEATRLYQFLLTSNLRLDPELRSRMQSHLSRASVGSGWGGEQVALADPLF